LSRDDEIQHVLSLRGQATSKRGRPTNFRVSCKDQLSDSARAAEQQKNTEDLAGEALKKANNADRAALSQLKKKIEKLEEYQSFSVERKAEFMAAEKEALDAKRFEGQQSGKLSHRFITELYLL
jgi:hypothetical protein